MDYVNAHRGERALVVACGSSTLQYDYDWYKEQAESCVLIACHNVPAYIPHHWQVSLHTREYWNERKGYSLDPDKRYAICHTGEVHELMMMTEVTENEADPIRNGKLNHFWTTGGLALSFAHQLGCEDISIIGLDFKADKYGRMHVDPDVMPKAVPHAHYYDVDTVLGLQRMIDSYRRAGIRIENLSECSLLV